MRSTLSTPHPTGTKAEARLLGNCISQHTEPRLLGKKLFNLRASHHKPCLTCISEGIHAFHQAMDMTSLAAVYSHQSSSVFI